MTMLDRAVKVTDPVKAIRDATETACARIAPTWPLDQWIAVNPYWGFIQDPIASVACNIASYSGSRMTMPRSFYRAQYKEGSLRTEHLQEALYRSGLGISMEDLFMEFERESPSVQQIPLFTYIADLQRDLLHGMSISDFVTHNVSQHCASYFDHCQSSWETQHKKSLYQSWINHARTDMSPWLLMGLHKVRHHAQSLPQDPLALIHSSLQALPVPPEEWANYLTAVLMSINGWASWCAYERWQARLSKSDDDHIVQLLAIRLAWEQFAFLYLLKSQEPSPLKDEWSKLIEWREHAKNHLAVDWVFQEALEISYQTELCQALKKDFHASQRNAQTVPAVQAVFCIDVRSEVFRRALEGCSNSIQTLGFAGFFGLPISYTPLGTRGDRPQLPGLLAPTLCATESSDSKQINQHTIRKRQSNLRFKSAWKDFRSSATSTFTFVESCGLFYAGSLLQRTLRRPGEEFDTSSARSSHETTMRPCVCHGNGSDLPSTESICDLVAGILTNMSLRQGFARLLMLTGHGSQSLNNPHAAGLDCGACGGHTGEVNARVLAGLLNDTAIRTGLATRGITIPNTTYVIAALHNTTTDEVTIFDTDLVPPSHARDLTCLQEWLQQAGHQARKERADSLGIRRGKFSSAKDLLQVFQIQSRDWSQVRPEWGLVNNAAFLIAPRELSRGTDLHGRVFLHEYHCESDPDGSVLESIMTAPMLVTNWINMQYYASTVDNRLYGSGNKVLHNVVGGRLGVFEGNGGDLRIGLPIQSLHDGAKLRNIPMRLSVFIEAPQSSIRAILLKHEVVRSLVQNGWIHLFQIAPGTSNVSRYRDKLWESTRFKDFKLPEDATVVSGQGQARASVPD